MILRIILRPDEETPGNTVAESDVYAVRFSSSHEGNAINAAKGALLHMLGDWDRVPNSVQFLLERP